MLMLVPPPAAVDWNDTERISSDAFLPESNKGFQLLLKMGWSSGTGATPPPVRSPRWCSSRVLCLRERHKGKMVVISLQGWDARAAGEWSRLL